MEDIPEFEYDRPPGMGIWFDSLSPTKQRVFLARIHARLCVYTWEYFEQVLPARAAIVFIQIRSLSRTLVLSFYFSRPLMMTLFVTGPGEVFLRATP